MIFMSNSGERPIYKSEKKKTKIVWLHRMWCRDGLTKSIMAGTECEERRRGRQRKW